MGQVEGKEGESSDKSRVGSGGGTHKIKGLQQGRDEEINVGGRSNGANKFGGGGR